MSVINAVVWGAGWFGQKAMERYIQDMTDIKIVAVTDSDSSLWGKEICGIKICSFETIPKAAFDKILICSSKYGKEISEMLKTKFHIAEDSIETVTDINYFLCRRIAQKYRGRCGAAGDEEMQEILNYIEKNPPRMFSYGFADTYMNRDITVYYDGTCGMYYVKHNGKKMFFPSWMKDEVAVREYYNNICSEQDADSPHRYLTDFVEINSGTILADVGAAEGIFALDLIDKIKFAYLIEAEKGWTEALAKTFEPFRSKVEIIPEYVSDSKTETRNTLDNLFREREVNLIKMDIEGEEEAALRGAGRLLRRGGMQWLVCTYHHEDSYTEIRDLLQKNSYTCETSRGYILCTGEWEKQSRDLGYRRGVLRARRTGP